MRKTLFFYGLTLSALSMGLPQQVYAQGNGKVIKVEVKSERLTTALKKLEKASGFKILFSYDDLNQFTVSSKRIKTKDIHQALNMLLENKPIGYQIEGQYVNLFMKEGAKRTAQVVGQQNVGHGAVTYSGIVMDESREPLMGVTVRVVGSNRGYATGPDGKFVIHAQQGKPVTLQFSYVGMRTLVRTFDGRRSENNVSIFLEEDAK